MRRMRLLSLGLLCFILLMKMFDVDGTSISKRSDGSEKTVRHGDELLLPSEMADDDEEKPVKDSNTRIFRVGDQLILVNADDNLPSNNKSSGTITKRSATRNEKLRWSDKTVKYIFDNSYSAADKKLVQGAMEEWARHTCLKFKIARKSDKNFIKFIQGTGCYSMVGMIGGQQIVSLGRKERCLYQPTALHELGHALGLFHTQRRPDRNQFIRVDLSDVKKKLHFNFNKQSWKEVHHFGVAYDYKSIMHYGGKSFTSNGGTALRTLNAKMQKIIGKVKHLSFGDIEMMNKMYQCKPNRCTLKDEGCPGVSFVDQSCKCVCPGPSDTNPVVPCIGTKPPVTPKPKPKETTTDMWNKSEWDWGDDW